MKQSAALLLASLLLAACSPSPAPVAVTDPYDRLIAAVGGEVALTELTRDLSPEQAQAFFASYGMGYQHHDALSAQLADGCPTRFASTERNKWHVISGGHYYIDAEGRPRSAYRYLPPVTAAARDTACQGTVGNLDNPNGYDGGHLIGSQLGGWGKRANMAPQEQNFNRGNWVQIENQAAKCSRLANGTLTYLARVTYPNSSTNTPSTWTIEMTIGSDTFTRTFNNAAGGGPNGTAYRQQAVSWLIGKGCS
ncbi:DNA/RNA non-specific endonuclease [Deinococcus sp. HMF7604]|uniref:DNA/RNA non-specific endonuclease n=1 Tax=Deinococcus betulae TaxID=2873312 RepID=UPI001CCB43D2|nr:DNA/RNA non-specific endonuclease [Deinococcus betulae]